MLMTRLGQNAKMVITGDLRQSDIRSNGKRVRSGLEDAVLRLGEIEGIGVALLRTGDIQRHPLIGRIIRAYEQVNVPDGLTIEEVYQRESRKTRKFSVRKLNHPQTMNLLLKPTYPIGFSVLNYPYIDVNPMSPKENLRY